MSRTIYALLVGINDYLGNVPRLYGCVNDVKRMSEFLKKRVEGSDFVLDPPRVLTSSDPDDTGETKPTRQAVIDGFRHHLCKAGENDIALFYYSGHGSQELAPEIFWLSEPDHLNETIVCVDSRLPGNYDLADKELALLIQEVATQDVQGKPKAGTPHIVIILDACHSGSATRDVGETHVRLAPTDMRSRPLDAYIMDSEMVKQFANDVETMDNKGIADWFRPPKGRHVVLSACAAGETAKEREFSTEGEPRGVFSYYLLETLQRSGQGLSYLDLTTRVRHQVRNTTSMQTPQIESTDPKDQGGTFLDGAVQPIPAYFQVNWSENDESWMLAAGALHGIQGPVENETTQLALFPFERVAANSEVNPFAGRAVSDAVGFARVTQVSASQSQVILEGLKESEDRKRAYLAVVVSQPMPPMQVALEGDPVLLDAVRKELNRQGLGDDLTLVVKEASDPAKATLRLTAAKGVYHIRRASDAYAWTVPAQDASSAVARLAHVARWLMIAALENAASQLPEDAVRIEMHRVETKDGQDLDIPVSGGDVILNYAVGEGKPQKPRFKLTLHNNTERELYCAVLDLPETFGIFQVNIAGSACAQLAPKGKPGASASLTNARGEPIIYFEIPKWLRSKNVDKLTEEIKIFISTDEINPALLLQDDLTDIFRSSTSKSAEEKIPKTTLDRLMRRVQTRHAGGRDDNDLISDWKNYDIRVTTLWPLDAVVMPDMGTSAQVGGDLTVQGHPGLQAKAQLRLKPFDTVSRDPDLPSVPPILRSAPESIQPFEFTPSRSAEPGHSALELILDNAADYSQITSDSPLMLNFGQSLAPSESVLMVSYDRENGYYVPIGFGYPKDGGTEIQVQTVPRPSNTGEKDVKGALLMLAYKLVPEKVAATIGLENPYPLLRVATVGEDGITQYEERGEVYIREQVEKARRILLFIHGWTGDTRGMIASTRVLSQLAPKYDLILAFDYENINTRIQDTAIKLRERLENVGLAAGHGKVVHIVAHSLGTQVSRWFIERDGGNQVVSKLVMMGPPNAGSPLAVLEEWAIYLIGLALNGLLYVVNPASAIVQLVRFASAAVAGAAKVDTTLDQIKPNSEFYKDLNRSPDPQCPYYVVIGSTKGIKYAAAPVEQPTNVFNRTAAQLFSPRMVHRVLSLAFSNQPNDIAVSVQSAEAVALLKPERNPRPSVVVVDCDHVSYFSSDAGLKELAAALQA